MEKTLMENFKRLFLDMNPFNLIIEHNRSGT